MRWNVYCVVLILSAGMLVLSCQSENAGTQTPTMLEDDEHKLTADDKVMAVSLTPLPIPNEPFPTEGPEGSISSAMLEALDVGRKQDAADFPVNPQEPSPLPIPVEPPPSK